MKKIAFALIAAGIGFSSSVFAAGTAVPADGVITPTGGTANCELLSERVKVNLSSNVVAAYNCDEANNTITVGTCHNAGSRNPSLTCAQIGTDTDGKPIWNDNACTETGKVIEGSPDFRGFFAQTSGGSVGAVFLGGACSSTILTSNDKLGE